MRILLAAAMIALLAGPAFAQTQQPVPKYGEEEKEKTQAEKAAAEKAAKAYERSLSSIPSQGPTDPWGNVRGDGAPKPAAKTAVKGAPAKRAKTGGVAE